MNVALVLAPSYNPDKPPLSLAYLKAYNNKNSVNVKCFDFNVELYSNASPQDKTLWGCENSQLWTNEDNFNHLNIINDAIIDKWVGEIMKIDPKIIGFSAYNTNMWFTIKLGARIREINKEVFILLGGPQVFMYRTNFELASLKFADAIILGEGETATKKIIQSIEKNGFITPMPGVITKIGNCFTGEGGMELIKDLDTIPFPDYDDFPLRKYKEPGQLPLIFSRGCVNKCAFCIETVYWQRFRTRSANNILSEIKVLIEKYNICNFSLNDSLMNGDMAFLDEFCNIVMEKNMNIGWWGMARINERMDRKFIEKMIKAGCKAIAYGVESGSQKVLNLMRKQYKVSDIETCIINTFKAGIKPGISLLVGFPGEEEKDFDETCEFIKKIGPYISYANISSLGMLEGTSIDNDRYNMGIIKNDDADWTYLGKPNNLSVRKDRINRLAEVVDKYAGKANAFK